MGRQGDQLERWGKEMIRGEPTVNSGATYEDADMKVDGMGGRLYEFKSTKGTEGISLHRTHIITLLQRGIKLVREPVFIFQNSLEDRYAILPAKILTRAIKKWDATGYPVTVVEAVKHALSTVPLIQSKGNNIRISGKDLKNVMELNGLMLYQTKNSIVWVIMEAKSWLAIAGDLKKKETNNV